MTRLPVAMVPVKLDLGDARVQCHEGPEVGAAVQDLQHTRRQDPAGELDPLHHRVRRER